MAVVSYNGARVGLIQRMAGLLQRKEAPFAVQTVISTLPQAEWRATNRTAYFSEGYKLNSAVFAVSRALMQGFAEPPLKCYTDETRKKELPKHPLRKLINRPNEIMGEDEFWKVYVLYAITGGNGYGVIVPGNGGKPAEIYPYSDLQMWPEPEGTRWVARYIYSPDNGITKTPVEADLVMHYKYAPDPFTPWRGMGALTPVAREVDSDNELTRYLKALLQNDAMPRTMLSLPLGVNLTKVQLDAIKQDWQQTYGGYNRGAPGIFTQGMEPKRLALDLQELAFDALRGVPEARIASAYGVPPIVAGLNIGLQRSTYSNYEEARKAFTEQTLVPLWKAVASEVQQTIVPLLGNDVYVDFDLTQVRALTENTEKRMVWIAEIAKQGFLSVNEVRAEAGKEPVQGGDDVPALKPPPPPPPVITPAQDGNQGGAANNMPAMDGMNAGMNGQGSGKRADMKKANPTVRDGFERRIEAGMRTRIEDLYGKAARVVEDAA